MLERLVSRKTGTLTILIQECFSKWTEKSFHYARHRRVDIVAHRLFVQFFFYLQGVNLPLRSSVKTCCTVEAFIQVQVVMQVFRHAMPHCCLSQWNKLGSIVAAGLKWTIFICPRIQPSQVMSVCQIVHGYICTCIFKVVCATRLDCARRQLCGPYLNSFTVTDLAMTDSLVSRWLAEHACCVCNLSPDTTLNCLRVCVPAQRSETNPPMVSLAGTIDILKQTVHIGEPNIFRKCIIHGYKGFYI